MNTPRTDALLQEQFRATGHIGPHNCPEWLVVHARQLELELAEVMARIESPVRCHRGHEFYPLTLWDCPDCHDDTRKQRDALAKALDEVMEDYGCSGSISVESHVKAESILSEVKGEAQ